MRPRKGDAATVPQGVHGHALRRATPVGHPDLKARARRGWQGAILCAVLVASALPAARARGATPGELVTINADHQQWIQDQLWCAQGNVHLLYQDISLRCDEVEVELKTMHLHAEGNVILDQGNTRIACSRIDFDLERKVGTLWNVDAFLPPTYYFRGESMEKLDETHYRFHNGTFTSCAISDNQAPPWSIKVRDALVELEGYGHFRGAALDVRGVPIFYTPRLLWPVKRDRAAGLLVPSFGFSSQRGAYFGNSFYWPISRSLDATSYLDLFSKNYVGLGQELRWAPAENAAGDVLGYFVWDPTGKRWEWKAIGKHNQLFPGGYALHAQLQEVSSLDFFQQFEGAIDRNALRTLYSFATLSRAWGPQALNLRVDHQRTFFTDLTGATTEVDLDRLGEAEYRLRSTRIGLSPLYLSAIASADEFQVNRSAMLRGRYGRLDLFPTLTLLTPGFAWLNVTPTIGARETYYTSQYSADLQHLIPESLSRRYATAGLSIVGPSFSRIWSEASGTKIKHLIEPRLDYSYVSQPGDLTRIPVFDEKDSVLVTNQVTWTLANRLFVKSGPEGSREVASFEISQPYSLSLPLTLARTTYDAATGQTTVVPASQRGPLDLWLRLTPLPTASLDARADLDPVTHKLQSTSLSGGLYAGNNGVNLTWFSGYDPLQGGPLSSQTRVYLGVAPGAAPWRLESQTAYDIHNQKLLEQRFAFRWRGSCWSALVEFRDYRIAPYQNRSYRIAIDLTGLGTFLDIHGALDSMPR
jgi:LPS-assembly protein